MEWRDKTLDELCALELFSFERLRIDTFVVEQGHQYHDLDDHDLEARHVFLIDGPDNRTLAYARIFREKDHVTFGRVATSLAVRGKGYGSMLMDAVLTSCAEHWPNLDILINAQVQVIGFYEKQGFEAFGDIFSIEHTPHRHMLLKAAERK
ncbi:MAG: GNAT family N-acetyltransferase [Bifidobacterium sp.]|uniref:GNAT family N-acetyltransferase n=1 Tax=Bifidobacterium sp. TaxID=41200 RepID=UPI0039E76023